jgi:ribonucleotide monophosphatase NagD (HAD superfamily)
MVKGVLIDLDGIVYVGNQALPGSLNTISRIRESHIPFKFITNTTRRPRRRIVSCCVVLYQGLPHISCCLS